MQRCAIAFSGGVDSTLLLHAVQRLEVFAVVEALHIDHGLHADSARWAEHCRSIAESLHVPFRVRRVSVDRTGSPSLEAAAREARYRALTEMLAPGDLLMTAHHGDDQLETVLLRVLRGTGVRGLTAIHELASLGGGVRVVRPLLAFSRAELRAQAELWRLTWLDDPANEDLSFDRSYLRAQITPALKHRWPSAHKLAQRLAGQMSEATEILEAQAARDAAAIDDLSRIPCATLCELGVARQNNLLRHLIRASHLPVPSKAQLDELRSELGSSRPGAQPLIQWPGAQARIYRDHLYLMPPLPPIGERRPSTRVTVAEDWAGDGGRLCFEPSPDIGLPDSWVRAGIELRFRCGGERFRPLNAAHRLSLKQWLQERGVVPWMRDRIPLLYHEDMLVAIADLGFSDALRSGADGPFWRPVWKDHPRIF